MDQTPAASHRRNGLLLVVGLLLGQAGLSLALIPPWQNADEPQHVATVRLALRYGAGFEYAAAQPDVERQIVESMARFEWWKLDGRFTPAPFPTSFAGMSQTVGGSYFGPPGGGSRLYYRSVADLFRTAGLTDLLSQLYVMRSLSAVASALTLMCVWAGTQLLLDRLSALVVTAMMTLHPQYVVLASTAGPDAFVYLAGAVVWWQAARLLVKPANATTIAAMWGAAIGAFLVRRLGAPLLLVAAAVTLWACANAVRVNRWKAMRFAAGTAVALICVGLVVNAAAPDELRRAIAWSTFDTTTSVNTIRSNTDQLPHFLNAQFQSFWLAAGWVSHFAADPWYLSIWVVILVAVAGLVLNFRDINWHAVVLAAVMVTFQLAAIVAYHFGFMQAGPGGRYMLPVLPAVLCLIWTGCRTWFGAQAPLAGLVMVAVAAALNMTAWMSVLLPAFA